MSPPQQRSHGLVRPFWGAMSSPGGGRWLGEPLSANVGRPTYRREGEGGGNERKPRNPVAGNGWDRGGKRRAGERPFEGA